MEQTHIFVLAHILRRPIIVYGVKYYKSFRGETLGYTRFQGKPFLNNTLVVLFVVSSCSFIALIYVEKGHSSPWVSKGRTVGVGGWMVDRHSLLVFLCFFSLGVYLPLLWEQSFCWKSPIALGYTRGHFSALVAMENDGYGNRGAGANLNTDDDVTITFLPLVDSERKLLHVHFLSAQEVSNILSC